MDSQIGQTYENMELLKVLENENKRLHKLVEYDWLTGVYNRGTVEHKINQLLTHNKTGVLFALDVNHFKSINDVYGHLCGDETLKQIGKKLYEITKQEDIFGRIGGDEFIIYMPMALDDSKISEMECIIQRKMAEITYGCHEHVSIAVCGCNCQENDTYTDVFARADQKLLQLKRRQGKAKNHLEHQSIHKDSSLIREELREKDVQIGAFCQEFESFKNIYRFMERYLCRSKKQVYIILLTLIVDNSHLQQHDQEVRMHFLKSSIQHALRLGDVFTQYSSCQFLIMAMDTKEEGIESMVKRMKTVFYAIDKHKEKNMILYHSFPLQAALETCART